MRLLAPQVAAAFAVSAKTAKARGLSVSPRRKRKCSAFSEELDADTAVPTLVRELDADTAVVLAVIGYGE